MKSQDLVRISLWLLSSDLSPLGIWRPLFQHNCLLFLGSYICHLTLWCQRLFFSLVISSVTKQKKKLQIFGESYPAFTQVSSQRGSVCECLFCFRNGAEQTLVRQSVCRGDLRTWGTWLMVLRHSQFAYVAIYQGPRHRDTIVSSVRPLRFTLLCSCTCRNKARLVPIFAKLHYYWV